MRQLFSKFGFGAAMTVTVIVVAVLLFAVWQIASAPVVPEVAELQGEIRFLARELNSMKERLERSSARESILEREADVLRQANRLLREDESERQAELGRLQSELEFFRRLAGTGGARSGLDVYRIEILPTDSARVFRFVLTLTQNIRRASIVSGRAGLELEGTMEDRPVTLDWPEISEGRVAEPAFRFKYYQQVEGYLTLPDGFSPTRLRISLEAKGQGKPLIRNYDWYELSGD